MVGNQTSSAGAEIGHFSGGTMTMVKLPNLDNEEVQRIVEALEHYCAHLRDAQREDARYVDLAEMLRRRTLRS